MESSELFLLAWAIVATVVAIYYHHIANRLKLSLFIHQMGFKLVAEGKAKIYLDGDKVCVREV